MNKKVVFAGYEFEQSIQRGIYLYSKSLIHAVKSCGYMTGLVTQAENGSPAILPTRIHHALAGDFSRSRALILSRYLRSIAFDTSRLVYNRRDIVSDTDYAYLK